MTQRNIFPEYRMCENLHRLGGDDAPPEPAIRIRLSDRRGLRSRPSGALSRQPHPPPRLFRVGSAGQVLHGQQRSHLLLVFNQRPLQHCSASSARPSETAAASFDSCYGSCASFLSTQKLSIRDSGALLIGVTRARTKTTTTTKITKCFKQCP